MLWSKAAGAGGTLGGGVLYSGNSGSVVSGDLVVPATTSDQMLVLATRTNSSTPAATLSGFTSAVAVGNSSRSLRVQYRTGAHSSETFNTGTNISYIIFDGATDVGQTATVGTSSISTFASYNGLSGVSSNGSSAIGVFSYVPSRITSVSGDFTTLSGVCGYLESAPETVSSGTITHDNAVFEITATVEFKA